MEALAIIEDLTPRCIACHLIGDHGNPNGPGPSLNGIGTRAGERVPGLSAREYIRQSILDPSAYLVEECPAGPCIDTMPKTFGEQLDEEEVQILIDFLLTLEE